MRLLLLSTFFIFFNFYLNAQELRGIVTNKKTGQPIPYVNIGVVGRNIGTVSDANGHYTLAVDTALDSDTLKASCIGYASYSVKVSQFRHQKGNDLQLEERIIELKEVVIRPKAFRLRTFGVTARSKSMRAGFEKNALGYECGILMKNTRPARLEKVNIHFASCSYDTIFYRLNIYNAPGALRFESLLTQPIYLNLPREKVLAEKVTIDLSSYNLWAEGNFLVTLEHVKDMGPGFVYFPLGLFDKTYYRKTSQAEWQTVPVGISISVEAGVEK
jgi:hypothetical protein